MTQINIDYFKSIFTSFGFNVSGVKGFDSKNYFVADNGFFSVFCVYQDVSYQPVLGAVTYLSSDKEKVEKTAIELEDFPDIYNHEYFEVEIVGLLHNHDYSAGEVVHALHGVTRYIKEYYDFKLK